VCFENILHAIQYGNVQYAAARLNGDVANLTALWRFINFVLLFYCYTMVLHVARE